VYLAKDNDTGKEIAIKVIKKNLLSKEAQ